MSNEVVVESLRLAIRRASHEDTPEHQPSLNDEGLRRPLIPSPHSTIHVFPDSSVMDIGTIPETIIQFADIPSLSLMSFGSTRSLSNFCGDSDQQLPESCRQWTKDSHKTLVNDSMMMTSRREDVIGRLGEDKQVFVWDPTIDARRVHIPMPNDPQLPTKDTSKAASRGDNGEPRKQPIALPQRNGTPPAKTTSGPQRPTKRYVDPRLDKRARKVAFKTATTLFSNERTFIHWIKFGMLLGTLAMTLLNFSGVEAHLGANQELAGNASKIGQHVGVSLMAICLLCLVYASSTYHWRHIGVVRGKNDDRHFDRIGPTLLALGLLVTYAINITCT